MKIFHDAYSHVIFVIVTDDMEWARQNLKFPGMQVGVVMRVCLYEDDLCCWQVAFLGHDRVLEKDVRRPLATADDIGDDLALLAACNHTILSYGTFGQWAAFLAGGKVVISDTASVTKEGRELREAGFNDHESGWTWLPANLNKSQSSSIPSLHLSRSSIIVAVTMSIVWCLRFC